MTDIDCYMIMIAVGSAEMDSRTVNVRNRDDEVKGKGEMLDLTSFLEKLLSLKSERRLINSLL